MKQIEQIASATNFSAINVGRLNELNDYVLELTPEVKIPGKVFGGAALGATGGEFSFQVFQPNTETGFLHTHKQHEELYFFLSGKGEFQVDGQVFPVQEGCVVRVAPTVGVPCATTARHRSRCSACSIGETPSRQRMLRME